MNGTQRNIDDYEEALNTLDLEPRERYDLEDYVDELVNEWKKLGRKAIELRTQRRRLIHFARQISSSTTTAPTTATALTKTTALESIAQIEEELIEVQEQMDKMELEITDLGEALETFDLQPDKRTRVVEYLDQLSDEWKELESEAVALRMQKDRWMQFVISRQNGTFPEAVPGTSKWP